MTEVLLGMLYLAVGMIVTVGLNRFDETIFEGEGTESIRFLFVLFWPVIAALLALVSIVWLVAKVTEKLDRGVSRRG